MREFLRLADQRDADCGEINRIAQARLAEVERKIRRCGPFFIGLIETARFSILRIGSPLALFGAGASLWRAFAVQVPPVGGTDGRRLVVIEEW